MDYEQKYKEALERARKIEKGEPLDVPDGTSIPVAIFPELKEAEGEKIRKELIKFLRNLFNNYSYFIKDPFYTECIAWLEKQREQKPYSQMEKCINCQFNMAGYCNGTCILKNKVEPKFKAGDWIIFNGLTLYINEVTKGYYRTISKGGIPNSYDWNIDNAARLWRIEDAKDGDVLVFEGYYNSIVLFQGIGINGKGRINYHCKCDLGNYSFDIQGDVACLGTIEKDAEHYHPATKEQCDFLFQRMKKDGYWWNAYEKVVNRVIIYEKK